MRIGLFLSGGVLSFLGAWNLLLNIKEGLLLKDLGLLLHIIGYLVVLTYKKQNTSRMKIIVRYDVG